MKGIYTNRNGRNEYTVAEIAKALAELNSCEPGDVSGQGAYITYYLHLDDEGNILESQYGEEECFVYSIHCTDYGFSEEEWEKLGDDLWDSTFYEEHENLEFEPFADCVRELTEQANKWLKENIENE